MSAQKLLKNAIFGLILLSLSTIGIAEVTPPPLSPAQSFLKKILPYNWEGTASYYSAEGKLIEQSPVYYSIAKEEATFSEWIEVDASLAAIEQFSFELNVSNSGQSMKLVEMDQKNGLQLKVNNLTADLIDYEVLHPDEELPLLHKVQQYLVSDTGPMIRIDQVLINGNLTATRISKLHIAKGEQ
ncbi:hypothetical protein GW915_07385 [bacterium]|nr:hypothetical protein [bacterium]